MLGEGVFELKEQAKQTGDACDDRKLVHALSVSGLTTITQNCIIRRTVTGLRNRQLKWSVRSPAKSHCDQRSPRLPVRLLLALADYGRCCSPGSVVRVVSVPRPSLF